MFKKVSATILLSVSLLFVFSHFQSHSLTYDLTPNKKIELLNISLTPEKVSEMNKLRMSTFENNFYILSSEIKPIKGVGMSNVPVLDQGQYGTCVTFASTAAVDARYNLGDFISQQCALQLNVALGNDLWDGAYYPSEVINPLKQYGVVSQSECNAPYPSRNNKITIDEYKKRVNKSVSEKVSSVQITYYSQNNLSALKSAISSGKRVLIAFLLNPNSKDGVKGYDVTIDGVKKYGGLWACSNPDVGPQPEPSPLEKCIQDFPEYEWWCQWVYGKQSINAAKENCGNFQAGHEVIATGYDDAQQLLKIRNSWGTTVGDSGEYYMSYEFFSSQVVDMTVVE